MLHCVNRHIEPAKDGQREEKPGASQVQGGVVGILRPEDHSIEWFETYDSWRILAVDDAGVAGWVRLGRDRDGDELAAEIRGLFVAPSRQGIGIGRSLVADGFGRMQALGYTSAKVQTLRGSPACEFYERLGGQLEGFVPFRGGFEESVYRWPSLQ